MKQVNQTDDAGQEDKTLPDINTKSIEHQRTTNLLEVNQNSAILFMIEDRIRKYEQQYGNKSGFFLGLICAGILSFTFIASEVYMPEVPIIEALFVVFLVAFLFNYYLIRDGEITPYIETESENFVAKISGISGFASMILFIFSFQKCELQTTLFCFGSSWIFYVIFQSCSNSKNKLNCYQILYGFLMIGFSGLILRPNFYPEIDMTKKPTNAVDNDGEVIERIPINFSHLCGVGAAFASGIFFGYMNMCIRQLKNQNFVTLTHIFTYIQAPFIPVFFPLQKLVSPSIAQWVFMVGLGLIFVLIVQLYIRSCQLESTTKSLLTIPQFIAFITIFSMLLGITSYGPSDAIKVLSAFAILGLSYKFSAEINSEEQTIPHNNTDFENQDVHLQNLSHNYNLKNKLLEEQH